MQELSTHYIVYQIENSRAVLQSQNILITLQLLYIFSGKENTSYDVQNKVAFLIVICSCHSGTYICFALNLYKTEPIWA